MKLEAKAHARACARAAIAAIMAAALLSGCAVAMLGGAARSGGGSASAPAAQSSDSSISTAVRARLSGNSALKALKIGVDTHDGIVTLTGQVNTLANKSAAQAEARAVGGVKGVNNQLAVR